jgi:excisionase family DNA binding protein
MEYLNVKAVSALTGLSVSTIYKRTASRTFPVYKPSGGRLLFIREEVENWIREGRVEMAAKQELPLVNLKASKK